MDWGKLLLYGLLFWLGGGLYASLMTIPLRVTGKANTGAFNLLLLTWLPVYGIIVCVWRPI